MSTTRNGHVKVLHQGAVLTVTHQRGRNGTSPRHVNGRHPRCTVVKQRLTATLVNPPTAKGSVKARVGNLTRNASKISIFDSSQCHRINLSRGRLGVENSHRRINKCSNTITARVHYLINETEDRGRHRIMSAPIGMKVKGPTTVRRHRHRPLAHRPLNLKGRHVRPLSGTVKRQRMVLTDVKKAKERDHHLGMVSKFVSNGPDRRTAGTHLQRIGLTGKNLVGNISGHNHYNLA